MLYRLGGTLFIPATHKNLISVANAEKYLGLKSIVIDTEDSISKDNFVDALKSIKNFLKSFKKSKVLVFLRPRDTKTLKEFLNYKNINKIDGFVLPKFSLTNADNYFDILKNSPLSIMPSIEGDELFDLNKLIKLKEKLLPYKSKIILIRFGLEDMLKQLKMRRGCDESIFDFSVTSVVLGNFIAIFKSAGFEISGGVYPCFKDLKGFEKDVLRDLKEGLFSKTIIHPNQIDIINKLYKVTQEEYDESLEIYNSKVAIVSKNNKMLEINTMYPHAKFMLQRAKIYGIK